MKTTHRNINKAWSVCQAVIFRDGIWYSFQHRSESRYPLRTLSQYISDCYNPRKYEYKTKLAQLVRKYQLTFSSFKIEYYQEFDDRNNSLDYLRVLCDDPKYVSLYHKSQISETY